MIIRIDRKVPGQKFNDRRYFVHKYVGSIVYIAVICLRQRVNFMKGVYWSRVTTRSWIFMKNQKSIKY